MTLYIEVGCNGNTVQWEVSFHKRSWAINECGAISINVISLFGSKYN